MMFIHEHISKASKVFSFSGRGLITCKGLYLGVRGLGEIGVIFRGLNRLILGTQMKVENYKAKHIPNNYY